MNTPEGKHMVMTKEDSALKKAAEAERAKEDQALNFAEHVLNTSLKARKKLLETADDELTKAMTAVVFARNSVAGLKHNILDLEEALVRSGFPVPSDPE